MNKLALLIINDKPEKVRSAAKRLQDEGFQLFRHNSKEAKSLIKENLSEVGYWVRNSPMLNADRLIPFVHMKCSRNTPIILLSAKQISFRKKSTWIDLGDIDLGDMEEINKFQQLVMFT